MASVFISFKLISLQLSTPLDHLAARYVSINYVPDEKQCRTPPQQFSGSAHYASYLAKHYRAG
jgi:hypothetical protein